MKHNARMGLVLLIFLLISALGLAQAQEPLKVAFVFVGPVGDIGWSYMHNQGRLAIDEAFGDAVETDIVENVNTANTEVVLNELIASGHTVIFTTSLEHQDGVLAIAEEHPEVQFVNAAGTETRDNVAIVSGRIYQARYLSGIVAGSMTQSNVIGYVAAFPFASVIRDINAFTLGVQEVNPDAVVRVVYTETWYDPVIESGAADSLMLEGIDLLAQHQDSSAVQEAAARLGAYSISYSSDMSEVGETVLTGPLWNWGVKYVSIIQEIMDGTYVGNENSWDGMANGIVSLAPFSPLVPEEVIELVNEYRAVIESETWDVFCGPIYGENDREEVTIVEEGNCLTDEELFAMNYYVLGVTGHPAPSVAPENIGEPMQSE